LSQGSQDFVSIAVRIILNNLGILALAGRTTGREAKEGGLASEGNKILGCKFPTWRARESSPQLGIKVKEKSIGQEDA